MPGKRTFQPPFVTRFTRLRGGILRLCLLTALTVGGCGGPHPHATDTPGQPITLPADSPVTASQPAAKQASQSAELERLTPKHLDWTGPLSALLSIRAVAENWADLVAEVKPTLTWGRSYYEDTASPDAGFPDMMWIDQDENGMPVFHLERAYAWKPDDDQPARWVLVELADSEFATDEEAWADSLLLGEQIGGRGLAVRLEVTEEIPPDPDKCTWASYAIIRGVHPRGGAVYELGWSHEMTMGTGHWLHRRLIYVWRDTDGTWRLLGEGPRESHGKLGGNEQLGSWCQLSVQWKGDPAMPVVVISRTDCLLAIGESAVGLPSLVTRRDATLDGAATLPATLHGLQNICWLKTATRWMRSSIAWRSGTACLRRCPPSIGGLGKTSQPPNSYKNAKPTARPAARNSCG